MNRFALFSHFGVNSMQMSFVARTFGFPAPRAVFRWMIVASAFAAPFVPASAWACACGCGIFDVGAQTLPAEDGLLVWFRYAYMNQNQNWERGGKAPASDNLDKELNTSFYTPGAAYPVNDDWTVMAELPVYVRQLTTTDDGTVAGSASSIYTGRDTTPGDLQLSTVYTGLSSDLSTGLSFGVKLPTGDYKGPAGPLGGREFDRDSLPGTGSTDLMLGGYHSGALTNDQTFSYFVQARYQFAVLARDSYRPGNELDAASGLSYDFGANGLFDKVAPVIQLIGSYRLHDTGANADPLNSGYKRLYIAPGIDLQIDRFRIFADVELPIYQYANAAASAGIEGTAGQLVAPALYELEVAYAF
jgi:hypothetical protein